MTWTDASGDERTASVRTENISERGVLLECLADTVIAIYRLVSLSLSPRAHERQELPSALRTPKVLAAIYRVEAPEDLREQTRRVASARIT
jgi:hypothetical protein